MATTVPKRIRWAVEQLDIRGDEAILEIGCGRGVAAGLIARKLTTGRLVAIDRSANAIDAARERNAALEPGKLTFIGTDIAGYDGAMNSFDIVFAINVNVFWLDPRGEMPVIRHLLKPDGRLSLFYEPPSTEQVDKIEKACRANLDRHDFLVLTTLRAKTGPTALLKMVSSAVR